MDIGRLDRRITLQDYTTNRASDGGVLMTWTTGTTIWGRLEPLQGGESILHGGPQMLASYRLTVRYSTSIVPGPQSRIVINSTAYNITSISEIGRREGLELLIQGEVA